MNTEKFILSIQGVGPFAEFFYFKVYDAVMKDIDQFYYAKDLTLDTGLYCIEATYNEVVEKKFVALDKNVRVHFEIEKYNKRYDELDLPADYRRKFHTYGARETTRVNALIDKKDFGNLYIFFQQKIVDGKAITPSDQNKLNPFRRFILLNERRETICSIAGKHVKKEEKNGWLAFNSKLPVGNYYLLFKGVENVASLEIPLRVFKHWQTDFCLFFTDIPLFNTASLSITKPFFHKNSPLKIENDMLQIEGVLQKLYNDILYLPDSLMEELAYGKWENPLKGILAAHVFFAKENNVSITTSSIQTQNLYRKVVDNVEKILGKDCPDVIALNLLKATFFNETLQNSTVKEPPMLLQSSRTLLEAVLLYPAIISKDSVMEQMSPGLMHNSVFTTYKPLPILQQELTGDKAVKAILASDLAKSIMNISNTASAVIASTESKPVAIQKAIAEQFNALTNVKEVARQLMVTPSLVQETVNTIIDSNEMLKKATYSLHKEASNPLNQLYSSKNIDMLKKNFNDNLMEF
ncbi:hypothetical protein Flavo103_27190 [Flavobacterium collinsii]|uniref:hypothetical protein n=1 Tax=Flavobacterium collinsii TaxID=1114861 RepID=UPI0022BD5721|nr:hypothetical protein [Flavobacterium collinsii]GIQ59583.1 hypothetical protein Flavo103_27190 [Flavobacterium collinsii]